MLTHYLAVYRYDAPFGGAPGDVVHRALEALRDHQGAFFPASMMVSKDTQVAIETPSDFQFSDVPPAAQLGEDEAWQITIDGADQSELVVTDDRAPSEMPASVIIRWSEDSLPEASTLESLLVALCLALKPTYAVVTDAATLLREDVYDRSFDVDRRQVPDALTWFLWLGPEQRAARQAARQGLFDHASLRDVGGGLLINFGDRPTADEPWWTSQRVLAETAMGLQELHARFPAPPF